MSECGSGNSLEPQEVNLFGHGLCTRGLGKLLNVSARRLWKFRKAIRQKEPCPLDGRLSKVSSGTKCPKKPNERELIFDFLTQLHQQCSEPMPEIVARAGAGGCQMTGSSRKGKRPRRKHKRDEPLSVEGVKDLRLLPPGSYTDYYRMFRAKNPECKVSFKLFTKATWLGRGILFLFPSVSFFVSRASVTSGMGRILSQSAPCPKQQPASEVHRMHQASASNAEAAGQRRGSLGAGSAMGRSHVPPIRGQAMLLESSR